MKEILLTSSVLILSLLLLRRLFRKTISRRVQYALWGLVALRLLVPVSLPAMEHNVLTAAEPVTERITAPALYTTPYRETIVYAPQGALQTPGPYQPFRIDSASADNIVTYTDGKNVVHAVEYKKQLPLGPLLLGVWYAGMAVMAAWFLLANLRFARRLRRNRTPYPVENCRYPVYLAEGLPSPCLFGLLRPAVYLTPAAVEAPETLRHVLAHETTHARHLDPLWSLLRCVCLVVYWFDPLVWIAAIVSRRDCELACDEGTLRRLGEAERLPYGQTLLRLIPVARRPGNPMLSATTMTAGKHALKERITRIAENRRTVGAALLAAVTAAALLCAATFTGAKTPDALAGRNPAAEPVLTPAELNTYTEVFNSKDMWTDASGNTCVFSPAAFLLSAYDRPEDVDLFQLFYNGANGYSPAQETPQAERQAVADAYFDSEDWQVDLTRTTTKQADDILEKWMGLTLAQTNKVSLEDLQYLPDYDAYYHYHGDTNIPHSVRFYAGERIEETDVLYYQLPSYVLDPASNSTADAWACVTVEPQSDGGFHIRSNKPCDRPDALLEPQPISGDELAFFNEEFFNVASTDSSADEITKLHNQFLSCLYARPEEIDLFSLLYNGAGRNDKMTEGERQQVALLDANGQEICPTLKMSTASIDAFLLETTGLTLAQTNRAGLDDFKYLPQYDAYYLSKGDTNYRSVTFTGGVREGIYVRLYWKDFYYGGRTDECVTLLDRGNGNYWFVSHLLVDGEPADTLAYPKGEPELTVPLGDIAPYEPQRVATRRVDYTDSTGDRGRAISVDTIDIDSDSFTVCPYLSKDGHVHAVLLRDSETQGASPAMWEGDEFFVFPYDSSIKNDLDTVRLSYYYDLLGCSGFSMTYFDYLDGDSEQEVVSVTDYYYLDPDGTPYLLARAMGDDPQIVDLDGDGSNELCAASPYSAQLFFRREGRLYAADVRALMQSAWPEIGPWDAAAWDFNHRRLTVSGYAYEPRTSNFTRYVYFDGSALQIYTPEQADTAS